MMMRLITPEVNLRKIKQWNNILFLAGPIPRNENSKCWRDKAIKIIKKELKNEIYKSLDFKLDVLTPVIDFKAVDEQTLYKQVEWEKEAMNIAHNIVFWIPRKIPEMIGMSTQFELGYWYSKNYKKISVGIPSDADKVRYLKEFMNDIPIHDDLGKLIKSTITKLFVRHIKMINEL
jgi:hypothetical protein